MYFPPKTVLGTCLLSYAFSYRQNLILSEKILVCFLFGHVMTISSQTNIVLKTLKYLISHTFLVTNINKSGKTTVCESSALVAFLWQTHAVCVYVTMEAKLGRCHVKFLVYWGNLCDTYRK